MLTPTHAFTHTTCHPTLCARAVSRGIHICISMISEHMLVYVCFSVDISVSVTHV